MTGCQLQSALLSAIQKSNDAINEATCDDDDNAWLIGGAEDQWEIPKVRNLMGALWIPISLVLGYSEQFSESL